MSGGEVRTISAEARVDIDTRFWLERELGLMQKLAGVLLEVPWESRGRVLAWFRAWTAAEWGLLAGLERASEETPDAG